MAEEEEDSSPLPWEVHTNTADKNLQGEAYIRCADLEDDILGEIVADVMNESDAHFIVQLTKIKSKSDLSMETRRCLKWAHAALDQWTEDEGDSDNSVEIMERIKKLLEKHGYDVE